MKISKDFNLKWNKFKQDRRAFISFIFLFTLFIVTIPAEFLCNTRPIILIVEGKTFIPVLFTYSEKDFGGTLLSEPDYLSKRFKNLLEGVTEGPIYNSTKNKNSSTFDIGLDDFEEKEETFSITIDDFEDEFNENYISQNTKIPILISRAKPIDYWILWPPIRYDYKYIPTESIAENVVLAAPYKIVNKETNQVTKSSWLDGHYLGTDDRGRDVLARLIYGLRISMIFGISIAVAGTIIGCLLGGIQGYFGGWVDLIGQRLTEIWGSIPRLYILIILSSFLVPSALLLFLILNLTAWMGIAAYIRAEFLKIRNFEYVKSAKAMGVSNFRIMHKHILPNALTPVITFFPFEVTAGILALVSLDFLNLGVPSPAPSIGELLAQGKTNLQAIWILLPTFITLTATLTMLTFVGEGIRNAFDPKRNN
ncbi:MAG: ABC transporter permease subunit [Nitrospinaceae bacterium]|nr:ABC transporter permease subunit [Nitrospinaceae bacterium]